jgi:hypothetical protein
MKPTFGSPGRLRIRADRGASCPTAAVPATSNSQEPESCCAWWAKCGPRLLLRLGQLRRQEPGRRAHKDASIWCKDRPAAEWALRPFFLGNRSCLASPFPVQDAQVGIQKQHGMAWHPASWHGMAWRPCDRPHFLFTTCADYEYLLRGYEDGPVMGTHSHRHPHRPAITQLRAPETNGHACELSRRLPRLLVRQGERSLKPAR